MAEFSFVFFHISGSASAVSRCWWGVSCTDLVAGLQSASLSPFCFSKCCSNFLDFQQKKFGACLLLMDLLVELLFLRKWKPEEEIGFSSQLLAKQSTSEFLWKKVKAFFFKPNVIGLLWVIAACKFIQEERFLSLFVPLFYKERC